MTDPTTDGGSDQSTGGVEQVGFQYNPEKLQVAEVARNGRYAVCPDCKNRVGASKSGGKPLPGTEVTCFGWSCSDCNLTLPTNCHGPTAPGFNDSMAGAKIKFRDGSERWVPVPIRYVEPETDRSGGDG